jgi:hypothetical protein
MAGAIRDRIDEAAGIDRREQLGERRDDSDARDPGDLARPARPMLEGEAENGPERLPPPGLSIERHRIIRRHDGCRLRIRRRRRCAPAPAKNEQVWKKAQEAASWRASCETDLVPSWSHGSDEDGESHSALPFSSWSQGCGRCLIWRQKASRPRQEAKRNRVFREAVPQRAPSRLTSNRPPASSRSRSGRPR